MGYIKLPATGGGGAVSSVNTQTGAVVLTAASVGADAAGTAQTLVNTLGDKYVRTTRFASIGTGTSGAVTLPALSEVVLDDFGGTVDAVVSTISVGKPTFQAATTASGEIIATTFDGLGNWVLTGTPAAYPVAIVYRVRQQFANLDSASTSIIGIPTSDSSQVNIQAFQSSGTWTKPAGAKTVKVYALAGGGGGGSGRKGLATTVRCGGGGGAPGSLCFSDLDAASLGATETVTIGAGGVGGAAVTLGSTNGNNGGNGGNTSFGLRFQAIGGGGGGGGTPTAGAAGASTLTTVGPLNFAQSAGAVASATGGSGATGGATFVLAPTGGASGGGLSSTDVIGSSNNGGSIGGNIIPDMALAGGVAGGIAPANASNGNSALFGYGVFIGTGGGSTRASGTANNSGTGGNGGPGAGGGGSGAAIDATANVGAAGNGGNGWLVVITYF